MKRSCRFCSRDFVACTVNTRQDISFLKVLAHVRPEIRITECVISFAKSKMSKVVMSKSEKLFMNATVGRDYKSVTQKPKAIFN